MEARTGIASPQGDSELSKEVVGSGGWIRRLVLWPKALPMERTIEMVSLARPPRVSATRGVKSTPSERQSERWLVNFR